MGVNRKELIECDMSNAKKIEDDYSFQKAEHEFHAWYDAVEDRTYCSSSWPSGVTKLQKNKSFVATRYHEQESGNVSHIVGYVEGMKLTVRS